ncbi:regulator of sigma E protease [Weissella uvarum]|uniref:RIP metalloprotease RseP n=1 Tax=Weissella uvarum TaxID=1479233 RepID=UPI0019617CD2|nr:RIP metalloprotease RseP [Weissella uvarum]MBM7617716.1 regulator of sigma E protease [Weissella uvarum]MCM0596065.1 RIP metalloprotease RseP [Weissella uvarum]
MQTLITFILVFGVIVIVHEFGHFYFAKKAGVRVREFAIGMGPKLFQMQHNKTTYTLRILPVGGYVRMASRAEAEEIPLQAGMTITIGMVDGVVEQLNLSDQVEIIGGRAFTINDFDLVDALFIEGYFDGDDTLSRLPVDHDATLIESDGTEVMIAPRDTQLESAKLWQRALINFAGPFNNFLLTLVLFVGVAFALPGVTTTTLNHVQKDSAAMQAGLKSGDQIKAIDGKQISSWQAMQTAVQGSSDKTLALAYVRDGKQMETKVHPAVKKIQGQQVRQLGVTPELTKAPLARLNYAWQVTKQSATQILRAIINLFQSFSLNKLGGPVAIYKNTEEVSSYGLISIISFTAMLSINLGMMNLLPIPALDGGKLLMNLIEAIFRRPISQKVEMGVTVAGAAILVVLMIAVTGNDLFRYFIK